MKTSELSGAALDWTVTRCDCPEVDLNYFLAMHNHYNYPNEAFNYSTNWALGGEIIEREGIALYLYGDAEWNAHVGNKESIGATPLIAAMRVYVASKLGDEVEIPHEAS
jgi:hypothetical protein